MALLRVYEKHCIARKTDTENMLRVPEEVFISGYVISGICHMIGLALLSGVKEVLPNQKLLIMNLSAIEMVLSVYLAIEEGLTYTWTGHIEKIFVSNLLFMGLRFAVLLMIVDRFLEVFLNIKYTVFVSIKRLRLVLVMLWLLSASVSIILACLASDKAKVHLIWLIFDAMITILDIVIVITAVTTYTYFYMMVRRIQQRLRTLTNQFTGRGTNFSINKFKVPFLVVLNFICFNFTGSVLATISSYISLKRNQSVLFYDIVTFFDIASFLSDICIYVFLQKKVRRHFLFYFRKFQRTTSVISDTY